jgi:hypothetical protein
MSSYYDDRRRVEAERVRNVQERARVETARVESVRVRDMFNREAEIEAQRESNRLNGRNDPRLYSSGGAFPPSGDSLPTRPRGNVPIWNEPVPSMGDQVRTFLGRSVVVGLVGVALWKFFTEES